MSHRPLSRELTDKVHIKSRFVLWHLGPELLRVKLVADEIRSVNTEVCPPHRRRNEASRGTKEGSLFDVSVVQNQSSGVGLYTSVQYDAKPRIMAR